MKKAIKVFITSALSLSMVFSMLYGTAYAQTSKTNQFVTIQAYEDAMSKIYANYGMEWKITDSSGTTQITKALYDSEIARATKECKEYQTAFNKSKAEAIKIESITSNYSVSTLVANQDTGAVVNSMMPVTKNVSASCKVTYGLYCSCYLVANANYTYNADNNTTLSLNSWSVDYTTAVNLDQWVDSGSRVDLTSYGCYAIIKGSCYFSYTIPVINTKVSQVVPVYEGRSMS